MEEYIYTSAIRSIVRVHIYTCVGAENSFELAKRKSNAFEATLIHVCFWNVTEIFSENESIPLYMRYVSMKYTACTYAHMHNLTINYKNSRLINEI